MIDSQGACCLQTQVLCHFLPPKRNFSSHIPSLAGLVGIESANSRTVEYVGNLLQGLNP